MAAAAPAKADRVVAIFDFKTRLQDTEGDTPPSSVVVSLDDPPLDMVHIATARYWLKFVHAA
jgi:hypothetical protein